MLVSCYRFIRVLVSGVVSTADAVFHLSPFSLQTQCFLGNAIIYETSLPEGLGGSPEYPLAALTIHSTTLDIPTGTSGGLLDNKNPEGIVVWASLLTNESTFSGSTILNTPHPTETVQGRQQTTPESTPFQCQEIRQAHMGHSIPLKTCANRVLRRRSLT